MYFYMKMRILVGKESTAAKARHIAKRRAKQS